MLFDWPDQNETGSLDGQVLDCGLRIVDCGFSSIRNPQSAIGNRLWSRSCLEEKRVPNKPVKEK
jgi:hypothetical protein